MEIVNVLLVEKVESEAMKVADYLGEISTLDIDIQYCSNLSESHEILHNESIDIVLLNLFLSDGYGMHSYTSFFSKFSATP